MRLLDEIEELTQDVRDDVRRVAEVATDAFGRYIDSHAGGAFEELRRHRPIFSVGRLTVVTLADDVREVLDDHEHLTVALYEEKMPGLTGPFILGLDDTPQYRYEDAALRRAVRPDDLPAIEEIVLAAARARVAGAADGEIDVVSELADPVLDHVIAEYLGFPGSDTAMQLRWSRSVFEEIFINVGNLPSVRERAAADAAEARAHFEGVVADRKAALEASADVPDDVLTRLLRLQPQEGGLDDVGIRRNLMGLIAGWIPTASKAFSLAVEELLRRPAQLETAQQAASEGNRDLVAAHVFEAMRFRPQNWGVLRHCAADRTVAAGTDRETTIPAGDTVVAATQSAMFDERAVEAPDEFRLDRPWHEYMHFGHGLHTCFGEAINRVQLPALATALLEGPPLGRASELDWDGPFPSSLRVSLGG